MMITSKSDLCVEMRGNDRRGDAGDMLLFDGSVVVVRVGVREGGNWNCGLGKMG